MSVENLKKVFDQATKTDFVEGGGSYHRYNHLMKMIGQKWGYDHRIVAAVFCALSPNNDYHGNLRDAKKLLSHHRIGFSIDSFKVSTYGANKRKAWALAGGSPPLELLLAPKTRSFFLNVCDPDDPAPVTVDGHIYNCWTGVRKTLVDLEKFDYEKVAEDVRVLARENRMVPSAMQGVLWFTWKRIHGILSNGQTAFWHEDMTFAGIGFHTIKKPIYEYDPKNF